MARKRQSAPGTARSRCEALRLKGVRFLREGDHRRSAVALRESAAISQRASTYVLLGVALERAGRTEEALEALKQALWLHKQGGHLMRARVVARLVLRSDPHNAHAARLAA